MVCKVRNLNKVKERNCYCLSLKFYFYKVIDIQRFQLPPSCCMVCRPWFIIRNYLKSYAHTDTIKGLPAAIGRVLIV